MHSVIARLLTIALLLAPLLGSATTAMAAPLDFPIPAGHFYTQANGRGGAGGTGYAVVDATENFPRFGRVDIPFDSAFRSHGGVPMLGFPASRITIFPDFPIQVFQKLVLQFQPGRGVFFLNTFDIMHEHGFDAFLDSVRSIPPPFSTAPDTGLSFPAVVARHQAFLNQDPAIRSVYFSVPDPVAQFGLPMSFKDYGNVFVIRAQRAAFQHWRVNVGPNRAGSVTIVNGGDVGKEVNLFPAESVVPVGPPSFSDNILVLEPGVGQTVHSPITVSGYARLFEAQGNFELTNSAGGVIKSGTFMAVAGTQPTFARYDFTVTYSVPATQAGTLTLFSLSPRDGSRINVVKVPLTLSG
ncbi:MAG TPA: Gmad2 immunoglobulin-like domain-containing protein [Chloroflexota bacterium]|nr:Gmad2 immunoglobulin-like domain-containing protein [Chloroflexota bacterium]